jgi:hypothetical protein
MKPAQNGRKTRSPVHKGSTHACALTDPAGLITIETAAEKYALDVRRLRGYIHRDTVRHDDPRGCLECGLVYEASVERFAKRAAESRSLAKGGDAL